MMGNFKLLLILSLLVFAVPVFGEDSAFTPQEVRLEQAGKRAKASFSLTEEVRKTVGNPIDSGFDGLGRWVYRPVKATVNGLEKSLDAVTDSIQEVSQKGYDVSLGRLRSESARAEALAVER
jgi:hypothetical protein